MKKIYLLPLILLAACTTQRPLHMYSTSMYAKGGLEKYNLECPGCHVEKFDRADILVAELSSSTTSRTVDACHIAVEDSLQMKNIQTDRVVPVTSSTDCETLFNKEKSYLKAMGFAE